MIEDASTFLGLATQTWLWIGSAALFTICIAIFAYGGDDTEDERTHTYLHGIVCAIAGTAYFCMASGLGDWTLASGRDYDFARYIDWSLTTPLLLIGLCATAMHGSFGKIAVVAAIVLFDVLMIWTSLLPGFLPREQMGLKLVWFALSCVFFLAVLYLLWTAMRQEAEARGPTVARVFKCNATFLTVVWLAYPVIILVGHNELGLVSKATTAGVIVFLDVTAKGVYGLMSSHGTKQILRAERAERAARREPDRPFAGTGGRRPA